ncbi:RagB/SusD family nutrient uptake outer membrane protein [Algoriphagus sp. H41]|uniref:RagB/SusD family nutrient uptake outer membrane protein n=1 Tax=Algoriphagus oliviformis TaxID=2811231 RepID=A0ABS3CB04_9BACT|nr:RagB/SusD family nutrient uptake outer membrane protein [Algoriphagus oliviformis]MBN7813340.1 RagB/SusD family nutrient uptake outer membrane protein [Algoriphagus oliviformis]
MKKIKLAILFVLTSLVSNGCMDVLDTKPGNAYSDVDIYSNIELTERYVFYAYNSTENWGMNFADWWTRRINIENASDEAWFHFVPQNFLITRALIAPNNLGFFRNKWASYYSFVGVVNQFLVDIEDAPVAKSNPEEVAILKAEMLYLRANAYAKLINFHGGVPLIDKPFQLGDDFVVPRSSYEDCVDFIVKDLNDAIALLPDSKMTRTGPEFGRVSKGACMALKSRVLLYAASELHDPATVPNGPLYDYTKPTKWQDAADAAKELIDANAYSLVPVSSPKDYQDMFLKPNSELILGRPYSPEFPNTPNDFNTLPDKAQSPHSSGGWGLSNPTHNFVMDFKMANGKRVNEPGSGYDENAIYANRELRMYANINFQGADFRGGLLDYSSPGGADAKEAPGQIHYAATGYNLRKFLDESITIDVEQSPRRPYPLARLPEIYLNYAEAQFHLGNEEEARKYVSMVAQRVGLPAIQSSGQALLEDIKYERQMELAYEGHRFFDLRRWMDADKIAEDIQGVQWKRVDANGNLDKTGRLVMTKVQIENRSFVVANYYLPIPLSEVEKTGILQNYGY